MFFSNLLLDTNYELRNRYLHIDYVDDNAFQSVNPTIPKSQFDTLECTLEELAVLELIFRNPAIKQKELVTETGKSLSTVSESWNLCRKRNISVEWMERDTVSGKFWRNSIVIFDDASIFEIKDDSYRD